MIGLRLARSRGVSSFANSRPSLSLSEAKRILSSVGLGGAGSVVLDKDWRERGLALLKLSNPKRANALSCSMMLQFSEAVAELESWQDGRAVILSGDGSNFCAGADLQGEADFFDAAVGEAMNAVMTDAANRLLALECVSCAAINGSAVGGGAELATACDFRVGESTSSIQFIQSRRGLVPGWGGAGRLLQILPRNKALWLLASGHKLDMAFASSIGLVDAVFDVDARQEGEQQNSSSGSGGGSSGSEGQATDIIQGALSFLANAAHFPSSSGEPLVCIEALRATKRVVAGLADGHRDIEARVFCDLWGSDPHLREVERWAQARKK